MWKIFKLVVTACCLLLVGCSTSDFVAYEHASQLITTTSEEIFDQHEEYILAHTTEALHSEIIQSFRSNIFDPQFKMTRVNAFAEETGNISKVILEYECSGSFSKYMLTGYFEYENDLLTDYSLYRATLETY